MNQTKLIKITMSLIFIVLMIITPVSALANQNIYSANTVLNSKDTIAPITKVIDLQKEWQNTKVEFKLIAKDNEGGSGVKATYYAIVGFRWTIGNIVEVTNEGESIVEFYSEDHAGNKEEIKSVKVYIDLTKPESSHTNIKKWTKI